MFANEFECQDITGDRSAIERLEALIRDCNCQIEAITHESNAETYRMRLYTETEAEIDY